MLRLWTSPRQAGTPWDGEVLGSFWVWRLVSEARNEDLPLDSLYECEEIRAIGGFRLCLVGHEPDKWKELWALVNEAGVAVLPGDRVPAVHAEKMQVELALSQTQRMYVYNRWDPREDHHERARRVRKALLGLAAQGKKPGAALKKKHSDTTGAP